MVVRFPGLHPEDPFATLKVTGWGNLAQEIQANYHQGDRVILEGRLNMNTVERPEGFKEKLAEMTVQRLQRVSVDADWGGSVGTAAPASFNEPVTSSAMPSNGAPGNSRTSSPRAKSPSASFSTANPVPEPDLDEIPF
jgi:single-stranded DNA-binding protein